LNHYIQLCHSNFTHRISEAFFIELKQLAPLAQPFAEFYNADAARSSKLYNWLMRIIRIPRQDLNSFIASNVILLGDAAHAMPIFAVSVRTFRYETNYLIVIGVKVVITVF
jgi:hypothetical protein